jgi:hypothetical protein
MKNLKFLSLVLITAFVVAGTVFVGVPAYKAWATTSQCLVDPVVTHISDETHLWYPCAERFSVIHYGTGGNNECSCAHSDYTVYLEIWDITETTRYVNQQCNYDDIDCNVKLWCADTQTPNGTWHWRFHCSNGEYTAFQEWVRDYDDCDGVLSWHSSGATTCEMVCHRSVDY